MKIIITVHNDPKKGLDGMLFANAVQMLKYYLDEIIVSYQKNVQSEDGYLNMIHTEIEEEIT